MRMWYRALVVITLVATTFCTSAMICLGCSLWQAGRDQSMLRDEDRFHWSNGVYQADGELNDGVLQRMVVERALPAICEEP